MNERVVRDSGGSQEAAVIEVAIGPGNEPGTFKVIVVRSPAGEATSVVGLSADALLARRDEVQSALLLSAVSSRGLHKTEIPIREVGQMLFTALLGTGEVAWQYRASAALAANRGQALRLVLRIDTPELASLPWEAMYDQAIGAYLCRHEQLVRHVPVVSTAAPLAVTPPLRILAVVSAPRGLPSLDADKERDLLATALARPISDGLIDVTWSATATWADLHDLLLDGPWHVLHFIGHGDFDPDADEGILALTRPDGRPDLIEASRFTDLLRQARPMPRLVVLNSCSSATASMTNLFAGTAAALSRAGIPAVAAMQFEITDTAATAFARGFYTAIARGRGVDDAVSAGRIAILGTTSRTLEWLTPVLYLRGHETELFSYSPAGNLPTTYAPASKESASYPSEEKPPAANRNSARTTFDPSPDRELRSDSIADHLGTWRVYLASARGAEHTAAHMPNQDAGSTQKLPNGVVLAVADGDGHPRHFRSDRGSRMAVEAAMAVGKQYAHALELAAGSAIDADTVSALVTDLVTRWRSHVTSDLAQHPVTEAESIWINRDDQPETPYASTLLMAILIRNTAVLAQIGRGDIFLLRPDGRLLTPTPDDGLEGTRMAGLHRADAVSDFRIAIVNLSRVPVYAIFAATGGFSGAQAVEHWRTSLAAVGATHGPEWIGDQLSTWAMRCASSEGSGDDITAVLAINTSAELTSAVHPGNTTAGEPSAFIQNRPHLPAPSSQPPPVATDATLPPRRHHDDAGTAQHRLALRYTVRSDAGLFRDQNQDASYAGPHLLAVADGMGDDTGQIASAVAIKTLAPLDAKLSGTDMLQVLAGATADANAAMRLIIQADPTVRSLATTVTALVWSGDEFAICHLGDSRAYLMRDGILHRMTHDHTLVQQLVDEGRITPEAAASHPQRAVLVRALDSSSSPDPDLEMFRARAGDRYLLCTDGLTDVVADETLATTLRNLTDLDAAIEQLIDLAIRNGGPDNITCVLADIINTSSGMVPSDQVVVTGALTAETD